MTGDKSTKRNHSYSFYGTIDVSIDWKIAIQFIEQKSHKRNQCCSIDWTIKHSKRNQCCSIDWTTIVQLIEQQNMQT